VRPPADVVATRESFNVRTLGGGDAASMRAMLTMFGNAFDEVETYTARQPDDAYLEGQLASPAFVAVAAFSGSSVIGGLAAYVLPKFEQARAELYIYDLAVDEEWRRRGVATALIEELKTRAAARGIHVMFVQADLGDEAAIALYTRLGVRADVLHFDIAPSPQPDPDRR
jgi:aminoglycoside 3-N-acetyltransferase I